MSASLMRARIATRILSGLYEDVPTMLTSAIRLMVELPGAVSVYDRCQSRMVQRLERSQTCGQGKEKGISSDYLLMLGDFSKLQKM
jgi:hypothetical protein